ncbi:Rv1733c family protein [Streptomyces phaeoluteigriseus]|uniref:Rv1733c family protein n=1 Tax=Streptomyces phaeoluteigriseus TaxID=114686 RepID=UPI0036A80621
MAFRGPRVWRWRWRRNPLKRRSDTVEAWVVLGAWTLTVLCGVLAGWAAARSVEQSLARERVEWRPVAGRLTERAPGKATAHSSERVWAEVGWTGPDGSAHAGQARVVPGSAAGTTVTVWTDRRGRMVTEPATAAQARVRASLVGGLAGVTVAVLPLAGGRYLRGRLERRRMDRWGVEWALFDAVRGRSTG